MNFQEQINSADNVFEQQEPKSPKTSKNNVEKSTLELCMADIIQNLNRLPASSDLELQLAMMSHVQFFKAQLTANEIVSHLQQVLQVIFSSAMQYQPRFYAQAIIFLVESIGDDVAQQIEPVLKQMGIKNCASRLMLTKFIKKVILTDKVKDRTEQLLQQVKDNDFHEFELKMLLQFCVALHPAILEDENISNLLVYLLNQMKKIESAAYLNGMTTNQLVVVKCVCLIYKQFKPQKLVKQQAELNSILSQAELQFPQFSQQIAKKIYQTPQFSEIQINSVIQSILLGQPLIKALNIESEQLQLLIMSKQFESQFVRIAQNIPIQLLRTIFLQISEIVDDDGLQKIIIMLVQMQAIFDVILQKISEFLVVGKLKLNQVPNLTMTALIYCVQCMVSLSYMKTLFFLKEHFMHHETEQILKQIQLIEYCNSTNFINQAMSDIKFGYFDQIDALQFIGVLVNLFEYNAIQTIKKTFEFQQIDLEKKVPNIKQFFQDCKFPPGAQAFAGLDLKESIYKAKLYILEKTVKTISSSGNIGLVSYMDKQIAQSVIDLLSRMVSCQEIDGEQASAIITQMIENQKVDRLKIKELLLQKLTAGENWVGEALRPLGW